MSATPPLTLVSFDIDGTLEVGDPPGAVPLDLVRRARSLGYIVGSSSDRVVREQESMWRRLAIEVHFVGHKHRLDEVRLRYPSVSRFIHIGDTEVDRYYAVLHGFEFYWQHTLPAQGSEGWIF